MREITRCTLFEAARRREVSLLAIFGGQGTHNANSVSDLRQLVGEYPEFSRDLLELAKPLFPSLAKCSGQPSEFGFDLDQWLQDPESTPDRAYLAAAPISFPMNGLISLVRYAVFCRTCGLHPGQLRASVQGTTGHSQGIIIATAIASAHDWDSFLGGAKHALVMLFWMGLKSHLASPRSLMRRNNSTDGGTASPMMSVKGLTQKKLEDLVEEANSYVPADSAAYIALVNSIENFTVSGPPATLQGLRALFASRGARENQDQTRVPFHQRLPQITYQFLPISAAFHSPYLQDAVRDVVAQLPAGVFMRQWLRIPVYNTCTGKDLRDCAEQDLRSTLAEMVMSEMLDWPRTLLRGNATHILDFGPGNTSGLLHTQMAGSGIRILPVFDQNRIAGSFTGKDQSDLVEHAPQWGALYRPQLEELQNGSVKLQTNMTKMLGMKPVMVAGMTPTTASPELVAAVLNAGYHVELAGGAYSRASDFEAAIRKVARSISKEQGITCNLIYANPKAMAWQIPLLRRLVSEGINIQGLTIGAGIPSPEIAIEYIESLLLKHVSFKPSSVQTINQVLAIANARPDFTICIQWTSGRAGGHHSSEDFHQPILQTYASIRAHPNVILIAGGGFGRGTEAVPYLSGEWSQSLGYAKMPFDGILLGSRMMTAKEARTSTPVKEVIARTVGTSADTWYHSLDDSDSGVVSVTSELGEPIWKVATRAVILWKELDETIFSIKDRAKRLETLLSKKEWIIHQLNANYAKPWFAVDSLGNSSELEDMTYIQVIERLVRLMYLRQHRKWIHESYRKLVLDFIARTSERFPSFVLEALPSDPMLWPTWCAEASHTTSSELLHPVDALFFIDLCRRPGQKPVNFIPKLDENFETWFKKDSLWQMENIEAVIDEDPQRVCIIHGPVAAQYSNSVNEPAGEILDGISEELVHALRSSSTIFSASETRTPFLTKVQDIAAMQKSAEFVYSMQVNDCSDGIQGIINEVFGDSHFWLQDCLSAAKVSRDGLMVDNPILACLQLSSGDKLTFSFNSTFSHLEALALSKPANDNDFKPVVQLESSQDGEVSMVLSAPTVDKAVPGCIEFKFQVVRKGYQTLIRETTKDRNGRIRAFFALQWNLQPDLPAGTEPSSDSVCTGCDFTITESVVRDFLGLMSRSQNNRSMQALEGGIVPMDVCIFIAWPVLMKPLMSSSIGGDLFRLLHRSNSFEYIGDAAPLQLGDKVKTTSQVTAVTISKPGKTVVVVATIYRDDQPVVKVKSSFFIQGNFDGDEDSYRLDEGINIRLGTVSRSLEAVLRSRSWITWKTEIRSLMESDLVVQMSSITKPLDRSDLFNLHVNGQILDASRNGQCVATIDFSSPSSSTNPVVDLFKKHSQSEIAESQALEYPESPENKTWKVRIPDAGLSYSRLSTDRNPIHTSAVFAGLASLPGPIVHGMWTSAVVRNFVENKLADADGTRFCRWSTSFEGMVRDQNVLRIESRHVAMTEGRMVYQIRAYNDELEEKVLEAEAEIEQPPTAYMFCGQGSQEKGMGMRQYQANSAARRIWDLSDKYLSELYGFSLLEIVREDPKELTIHFSGPKGRKLRHNYLALTRIVIEDGQERSVGVIEGLTSSSTSYTFRDSRGLLFSTQFSQAALTVMEVAEMEALRSRSLVQQRSPFAGHSLGEYAGLAACTTVLALEEMLSLVFYRGLVMQRAMERNEAGQTDYSMMAVNPSRIGLRFRQNSLEQVIDLIRSTSSLLLEIVNYNVFQQQYVCAGHLRALDLLDKVCTDLSKHRRPETLQTTDISSIIDKHFSNIQQSSSPVKPERGIATIPLQGIDVPFHSTYLRGGIDAYRRFLSGKILKENIDPKELVGKFIPNVIGKPFATSKEYVQDVLKVTNSEPLQHLLAAMA